MVITAVGGAVIIILVLPIEPATRIKQVNEVLETDEEKHKK